jgi:hypothetical protein
LASEATEPTERSKPSTDKEMVIPMAIIVTIEIERRMLMILLLEIKAGLATEKIMIRAKIVIIVPYL